MKKIGLIVIATACITSKALEKHNIKDQLPPHHDISSKINENLQVKGIPFYLLEGKKFSSKLPVIITDLSSIVGDGNTITLYYQNNGKQIEVTPTKILVKYNDVFKGHPYSWTDYNYKYDFSHISQETKCTLEFKNKFNNDAFEREWVPLHPLTYEHTLTYQFTVTPS